MPPGERRAQRVPGERRAFHADRKLAHTPKHLEFAEPGMRRNVILRHQLAEAVEERFGFALGLALDALGE